MKTLIAGSNGMAGVLPAQSGRARGWQRWAPYAAVVWSLIYAALGIYLGSERARLPLRPRDRLQWVAAARPVRTGRWPGSW